MAIVSEQLQSHRPVASLVSHWRCSMNRNRAGKSIVTFAPMTRLRCGTTVSAIKHAARQSERHRAAATRRASRPQRISAGADHLLGNADGFTCPTAMIAAWSHAAPRFLRCDHAAPHSGPCARLMWLASSLAAPLLGVRASSKYHRQQNVWNPCRPAGTGWWKSPRRQRVRNSAPSLAAALHLQATLTQEEWLTQIHPADGEPQRPRLHALQQHGEPLTSERVCTLATITSRR